MIMICIDHDEFVAGSYRSTFVHGVEEAKWDSGDPTEDMRNCIISIEPGEQYVFSSSVDNFAMDEGMRWNMQEGVWEKAGN